ncbi:hypothetical protein JOB18_043870, partial [Solea senegalensis]
MTNITCINHTLQGLFMECPDCSCRTSKTSFRYVPNDVILKNRPTNTVSPAHSAVHAHEQHSKVRTASNGWLREASPPPPPPLLHRQVNTRYRESGMITAVVRTLTFPRRLLLCAVHGVHQHTGWENFRETARTLVRFLSERR